MPNGKTKPVGTTKAAETAKPDGVMGFFDRIIPLGLKNAPVVTKFAIGALVVFVVATVVLSLGVAPSILFPATVGVIVIGVIAVLAARAVKGMRNQRLADAVAWFIVLGFVAMSSLLISSAFFGIPAGGARLLARWLDDPSLLPLPAKRDEIKVLSDRSLSTLPDAVRTPTASEGRMSLSEELAKRPDLLIVGARLVIDAGNATIAVRSLTLRNAQIVTNGAAVTIDALEVVSDGGGIVSFRDAALVSNAGEGGRVKQDGVELLRRRPLAGVGGHQFGLKTGAREVFAQPRHAAGGDVDRRHFRARGAELHRLASGGGTEIRDALVGDVAQ